MNYRTQNAIAFGAVILGAGAWITLRQPQDFVVAATPSAGVRSDGPTKIGTVQNEADIPSKVACGATRPINAASTKPQFDQAPTSDSLESNKQYQARIVTSCGAIVVHLDVDNAPIAVSNFVFLARQGFYDGLWFHRIVPDFVIQTGDPTGTGSGGPGYQFTTEVNSTLSFAKDPFLLAYARGQQLDTNGSQIFFTLGRQPNLAAPENPYTAFGKVVQGEQVIRRIASVPTRSASQAPSEKSLPTEAVYVESVTISAAKQ